MGRAAHAGLMTASAALLALDRNRPAGRKQIFRRHNPKTARSSEGASFFADPPRPAWFSLSSNHPRGQDLPTPDETCYFSVPVERDVWCVPTNCNVQADRLQALLIVGLRGVHTLGLISRIIVHNRQCSPPVVGLELELHQRHRNSITTAADLHLPAKHAAEIMGRYRTSDDALSLV
jgi:hypothetical protein